MKTQKEQLIRICRKEKGFALLEYVMGAALILGIALVGLTTFSNSLSSFFSSLGTWVTARTATLNNGAGTSGSGSGGSAGTSN